MLRVLPVLQRTLTEGQQQGPHSHFNIALLSTPGGSVQLLPPATPSNLSLQPLPKAGCFCTDTRLGLCLPVTKISFQWLSVTLPRRSRGRVSCVHLSLRVPGIMYTGPLLQPSPRSPAGIPLPPTHKSPMCLQPTPLGTSCPRAS